MNYSRYKKSIKYHPKHGAKGRVKRVIELKFFGRAISNNQKVEKQIKIQRVAVQLTAGAGQNLHTHRGESQF